MPMQVPVLPSEDGGSSPEAGQRMLDGAVSPLDAAAPTGDAASAKLDAGSGDAGADDGGMTPDASRTCELVSSMDELTLDLAPNVSSEGGFALAIGSTGFGTAYHAPGCGAIGALPVSASGSFAMPSQLLGDCSALEDLALTHIGAGWRIAFVDNSAGSAELQTITTSESFDPTTASTRTQLTHNQLHEQHPVYATVGSNSYLAWLASDTSGKREIDLARVDDSSTQTVLAADSGKQPISLAFAQLGTANAALAFVDEQSARGIWLLPLDSNLNALRDPVLVSADVSSGDSVDLATRPKDGGGVLYSLNVQGVNHEVRFRRLDTQGGFLGNEIKIVASPLQASDASFAQLGDGYAVAYRQLPGGAVTSSEIRLTFITKEGDPMRDGAGRIISYHVADAGPTGGRLTARISVDGQLAVGFLDSQNGVTKYRLVRKRLDCGLSP